MDQIEKLYDRRVISRSVYEAEMKKIIDQADKEMLDELEELVNKGLISQTSYNNQKQRILAKAEGKQIH